MSSYDDRQKDKKAVQVELTALQADLEQVRQATLRLVRRVGLHELEIITEATARSQLAVRALIVDQKPESST